MEKNSSKSCVPKLKTKVNIRDIVEMVSYIQWVVNPNLLSCDDVLLKNWLIKWFPSMSSILTHLRFNCLYWKGLEW